MDTFDYDRGSEINDGTGVLLERFVHSEQTVTVRVDETDAWVRMPVRTVLVDSAGWSLEIGPYSISGPDAVALINALAEFGRLSGEFRPAKPGEV